MTQTIPTGEELHLLAACRLNPDEYTPALMYADWLDERGRHEQAEFIRVSREIARLPPPHKQPTYPREAVALKKYGDRHYSLIGYPEDGFEVGDRLDLLVHRSSSKKPKTVRGFRVYQIRDYDESFHNRDEREVFVRLDAESGPWKGTALKERESALLAANPEWRAACPACRLKGVVELRDTATGSAYLDTCHHCRGDGRVGEFKRGLLDSIPVRLADVCRQERCGSECDGGHDTRYVPTPWALDTLRAFPSVVSLVPVDALEPRGGQVFWSDAADAIIRQLPDEARERVYCSSQPAALAALGRALAAWVYGEIAKGAASG